MVSAGEGGLGAAKLMVILKSSRRFHATQTKAQRALFFFFLVETGQLTRKCVRKSEVPKSPKFSGKRTKRELLPPDVETW